MFEAGDMRMAPYELVDIDDRLELHLEVPGIKRNTSCQDNQVFCGNLRQKYSEKDVNKRAKDMSTAKGCSDHSLYFAFYIFLSVGIL